MFPQIALPVCHSPETIPGTGYPILPEFVGRGLQGWGGASPQFQIVMDGFRQ
jgi:hypothetical protein